MGEKTQTKTQNRSLDSTHDRAKKGRVYTHDRAKKGRMYTHDRACLTAQLFLRFSVFTISRIKFKPLIGF